MTFTNRAIGNRVRRYPTQFLAFNEIVAFIGGRNRYLQMATLQKDSWSTGWASALLSTIEQDGGTVGLHQHVNPRQGAKIALVAYTFIVIY
jgi:hypothetical protein